MFVYLAHFSSSLHHAQHYLGLTNNLDRRELEHRSGRGSRLLQIVSQRGIQWEIVRTWEYPEPKEAYAQEKFFKRKLKSARSLCPICREEYLARKRQRKAERLARCRFTQDYSNL